MLPEFAQRPGEIETLQLAIIRDIEDVRALANEWEVLEKAQSLRVPFTSASWNILWWQYLRAHSVLIRDTLYTFTIRNHLGKLVCIAPMMISRRPGFGKTAIRVLQFFGADPNITEMRGLICDPLYADRAMFIIQRYLSENKQEWDWVEWRGLSESQAVALGSPNTRPEKLRQACYLPLPASWDELKSGLSRNMKEAIRKCCNSLARDNRRPELQLISNPGHVAEAIEHFFRLHAMRADTGSGVQHANVFAEKSSRAFLHAYAMDMARQDRLRIFLVKLDSKVVAIRLGFVCERQLYLYYSGYDTAWGRYSIMTTVVVYALQWAIDNAFEGVNLSTGLDHSKLRWQPQVHSDYNALQISPRYRALRLFYLYTLLRNSAITRYFAGRNTDDISRIQSD